MAALGQRNCSSSPAVSFRSSAVQGGRERVRTLWLLPLGYPPGCNHSASPYLRGTDYSDFWGSSGIFEDLFWLSLREGSDW